MKKIIVTGGAGFIGSHLVDALVAEGFETHVIDDLSAGKRERVSSKAECHEADITAFETIAPFFTGADCVFHLAARPRVQYSIEHPRESNEVNVSGTLNVLTAAHNAGVRRLVYSASSSAYGDQPILPLVETMSAKPKSPYGLQKYLGELYCALFSDVYGLETVCLRYFNVYGPRHDPDGPYALVIGKFLQQVKEGKPMTITGTGEQTRDFTHVRDVVRANLLAMESAKVGKGEVCNIGAGHNVSINVIARLIGGPVEYLPARLEPKDTLADNSKAGKLLGWKPEVAFEEGLTQLKIEVLGEQ